MSLAHRTEGTPIKNKNPEDIVESPELDGEDAALASYWTPERMATAEPLSFSIPAESVAETHLLTPPLQELMTGESHAPDTEKRQPHPLFSTTPVEDIHVAPYQCVGKLFMTLQGEDRVGSAYVIGESTIGTAGHCVYINGNWATNLFFHAHYHNGSEIRRWRIRRFGVPQGWTEAHNHAYDMAFGIADHPIRPTTGKLGWMARYPVDQAPYTQIGYPAVAIPDFPFDGQQMWKTVANYIRHTQNDTTPMIIKAGGNMTGGASGGPWVVFKDGHWRVNGVNSHRLAEDPYHIYSPYFGNAFVNLIEWMTEGGGDTPTPV